MNVTNIKGQIKKTFMRSARKFLSPELKEELGVEQSRYQHSASYDDTLNSFWDPVQAQNLTKKDTQKIAFWGIAAVVGLSILLLTLFFILIAPQKKHSKIDENTTLVVNGEDLEEKVVEKSVEDIDEIEEPVKVENIKTEDSGSTEEDTAVQESPLLKSQEAANVAEYHLQYGDTLESVCVKFYGSYSYDKIQKLKQANNIRNPRYMQIGQKLIIPF